MPSTSTSAPISTDTEIKAPPGKLGPVDITKVRNLVFQGGSVKGVSYGGAIGALHKAYRQKGLHLHQEILNIAGTSAGAITALAMAVGANVEELVMTIGNTDFKSFLDTKAYEIVSSMSSDNSSALQNTSAAMATLPLLTSSLGLASGQEVLDYLENFVRERTGVKHLTFQELHERVVKAREEGQRGGDKDIQNNEGRAKDLFVVAYNLTTDQPQVFSYLDTPNTIISDAVRCSMSIPYVFVPHKNYIKKPGPKPDEFVRVEASEDLWIDGGVTDNYPIRVFDSLLGAAYDETLGFFLASKVEKAEFEGKPVEKTQSVHREIKNILDYSKAVIETVISSQQISAHKQSGDIKRTIYIDHLNVSMMNFGLSLEEKNALISSGWDSVCDRLQMKNEIGKCEVLLQPEKKVEPVDIHDSFDIDDEGTVSHSHGDKCCIV